MPHPNVRPSSRPGELERADLVDKDLEDRKNRKHLHGEDAKLCITVAPSSERLGELHLNLQYEAKPGEYAVCQRGHNQILVLAADWIGRIVAAVGSDDPADAWTLVVGAQKCPSGVLDVALEKFTEVATGEVDVRTALAAQWRIDGGDVQHEFDPRIDSRLHRARDRRADVDREV